MVEDNEIKAVTSPFAIREGEIKVFDGKDGYVSMNQIIQRINLGHINDLHFKVLSLVNEFEFITSRQLFQLLETYALTNCSRAFKFLPSFPINSELFDEDITIS